MTNNTTTILGLWNMGENRFHTRLSPVEGKRIIKKALSMGINTFDSAYSYLDADSILYSALREKKMERNEWKIVEKVMAVPTLSRKVDSLFKRLKTDYLDVLLLHWPTEKENLFNSLKNLEKLKDEGKIKEYGVSNFPLSLLKEVSSDYQISYHERPLSLIWSKDYEEEKKLGIKILGYGPLAFGFLTSSNKPLLSSLPFSLCREKDELFQTLEKLAIKYNTTIETVAYSWVLAKRPYAVIRGVSNIGQLLLPQVTLKKEDEEKLDEISSLVAANMPLDNIFGHNYLKR